jgi:hypothetical protein
MTSPEQLLLQFDLTIIPDPVLAKYMVESFYEKEAKVAKSKTYYANLIKQPWGVIDAYPPKERYEYERIKNLSRQKWIRKFPPLATVGEEAYQRLKSHSQVADSNNTNYSFQIGQFKIFYAMKRLQQVASFNFLHTNSIIRSSISHTVWKTFPCIFLPTWYLQREFYFLDTKIDLSH